MRPLFFLENRKPYSYVLLAMAMVALFGAFDYLSGPEIASSFFYLLPISLVSWYVGKQPGIALSIVSAVVWLIADISSGSTYSSSLIYSWNAMVRLGFFLVVAVLLTSLHRRLEREKEMARTDFLTGAVNSRFFYELLEMEINRSLRYSRPFTVTFLDLDNFKSVNDSIGHLGGDQVLRIVVDCIRGFLRKTDVVARIGGDEFVLLLPETEEGGARAATGKIHSCLLGKMREHAWPVTFSIGVMTFIQPPQSVEETVRLADDLMYAVKNSGKNDVKYQTYSY